MTRAEVAQLVEHSPEKAGVDSSILSLGTTSHFHWMGLRPRTLTRLSGGYVFLGSREK